MKNENSKRSLSLEKIQVTKLANLGNVLGGSTFLPVQTETINSDNSCIETFNADSQTHSTVTEPVNTNYSYGCDAQEW